MQIMLPALEVLCQRRTQAEAPFDLMQNATKPIRCILPVCTAHLYIMRLCVVLLPSLIVLRQSLAAGAWCHGRQQAEALIERNAECSSERSLHSASLHS